MSANTTGDEYSRGRAVEERQQRHPKVNPRFRPVIVVVWAVGALVAFVTTLFAAFPQTTFWVVLVSHLALAWLIRLDIKSIRRQGVEWGFSRHLWFGAAMVVPLVAPTYYLYAGRVVDRENDRRRRKRGLQGEEAADSEADG